MSNFSSTFCGASGRILRIKHMCMFHFIACGMGKVSAVWLNSGMEVPLDKYHEIFYPNWDGDNCIWACFPLKPMEIITKLVNDLKTDNMILKNPNKMLSKQNEPILDTVSVLIPNFKHKHSVCAVIIVGYSSQGKKSPWNDGLCT